MTEFEDIVSPMVKKIFDAQEEREIDVRAIMEQLFEREQFSIKTQIVEWLQLASLENHLELKIDYNLFDDEDHRKEKEKVFEQLFKQKISSKLFQCFWCLGTFNVAIKKGLF